MSKSPAEQEFYRLRESYNRPARASDHTALAEALAKPIPQVILGDPAFHSRLRHIRGNSLSRIGLNDAAEREYQLGFYEAVPEEKGDYLLDWAMNAFYHLFTKMPAVGKEASAHRCMEILGLADSFADDLADPRYLLASIRHVRAFVMLFLHDAAGARAELQTVELPSLGKGFADDQRLLPFFTQLPKGILAALELKDANLIRRVALSALSADELSKAGQEANYMTPGMYFFLGAYARMNVPKYAVSWLLIMDTIHETFPAFPASRRLKSLVDRGASPVAIARFVDSLCGA